MLNLSKAVVHVELVVVATSFIASSPASKEALKTANLLKGLSVNAYIYGESGTGKKSLASYILPDAIVINAQNYDELYTAFSKHKSIIITDFDKLPNVETFKNLLKENKTRIVAISCFSQITTEVDQLFALKIFLPSLKERPEDVDTLSKVFIQDLKSSFQIQSDISISIKSLDLSSNAYSLKRSILLKLLMSKLDDEELMGLMHEHIKPRLGGENDYRDLLYLFEAPLINAGLQKFGTQIKLAQKLGLNRNTLRKKLSENKDYIHE